MTNVRLLLLTILCVGISVISFGQRITRFLYVPTHSRTTFGEYQFENKGIAGFQMRLEYDTVPLRNTLRIINREFKECYSSGVASESQLDLSLSGATILQEELLLEADENITASTTIPASMPESLFR